MKKLYLGAFAIAAIGTHATNSEIVEEAFTAVYNKNAWLSDVSKSGPGSDLKRTVTVRRELPELCRKYSIKSILDAPCGDFFWMKEIIGNLGVDRYMGVDIVPDLIASNRSRFSSEAVSFEKLDLVNDEIPCVDLILCRDCLIHLPTKDIRRVLKNFKDSGSKYLLMNTFQGDRPYTNIHNYEEVKNGGWRMINFERTPFNFPQPLAIIKEDWEAPFDDKCLALWRLEDLDV